MSNLPDLYEITQKFNVPALKSIPRKIKSEFNLLPLNHCKLKGKSIAVAVGSRGISHLPTIVETTIHCLKERELIPFIIPAMGSHGGATAQGQIEVLKDLGITEKSMGVPIVSNMDVTSLGTIGNGAEIFISQDIIKADYLMVINRVKPHTAFRGEVESGLCKMLTVGCGKEMGASTIHKYNLGETILPGAQRILEHVSVLCGLAVVETPDHDIFDLKLADSTHLIQTDKEFLKIAWQMLPRIPVGALDFLIISEMGKNISGAGIDPNVIGLWRREGGNRYPDYKIIGVLDITKESHGNAMGIGMTDLSTFFVRDKLNLSATYTNALTAWVLRSARMPLFLEDDKTLIQTVLNKLPNFETAKIGWIKNTLELGKFWVSSAVLPELTSYDNLTINQMPLRFSFDGENKLIPPWNDR